LQQIAGCDSPADVAPAVIAALSVMILGEETKGRTLENISH
jgi:hypothetical protein